MYFSVTQSTETDFLLLIPFNEVFLQQHISRPLTCRCHNSLTIRFIALHSTNGAPVQFPGTNSSNRQEGHAVEETLQLELVRGARRSRAPQTNTHVNGDPLSVFDDSTLSEVSDDEGRYICSMPLSSPLCH